MLTLARTVVAGFLICSGLGIASNDSCQPHWDNTIGQPGMDDGMVHALMVFDDGTGPALYAAGGFEAAGGETVNSIAKWNPEMMEWSSLGGGITTGSVRALNVFNDGSGPGLYAGGWYSLVNGISFRNIAKWDGSEWSVLQGHPSNHPGVSAAVYALAVFDDGTGDSLYLGGLFNTAGGNGDGSFTVNKIVEWSGTEWSALGSGVQSGDVRALAVFDDGTGPALYAGGSFNSAGDQSGTDKIAKWDGSEWSAVGSPNFNATVHALAVFDDGNGPALYAAGTFWDTMGDGSQFNRIAKWDGSEWTPLGSGTSNTIYAMTVFDDGSGPALYVGGQFTQAGGQPASRIARWDGSEWSSLDSGIGGNGVYAFEAYDDGTGPALHVGGYFTAAGGLPANNIAAWRGCATEESCLGDINGDSVVDGQDLLVLLANWGECNDPDDCTGDLNDDGVVDGQDLLQLLSAWGPCANVDR